MELFNHIYTEDEIAHMISEDPEGFKEGLFSVPEEIHGFDDSKLPDEETRGKSDAFLQGYVLGRNLARKNGKVEVQDV